MRRGVAAESLLPKATCPLPIGRSPLPHAGTRRLIVEASRRRRRLPMQIAAKFHSIWHDVWYDCVALSARAVLQGITGANVPPYKAVMLNEGRGPFPSRVE